MNPHTKKILLLAIILCSLALSFCLFLTFQINNVGTKLSTYISALSEKNAREEAFIKVNRLTQETTESRASLSSAFFSDEGNSISFLDDLETFATSIDLDLKTEDLNTVLGDDKKTKSITMTFVYSGEKEKVLTFTKLLEETPYHSTISSFEFKQKNPRTWEGKLTLLISLKPS